MFVSFDQLQSRQPTLAAQAQTLASTRGSIVTVHIQPFGADLYVGDVSDRLNGTCCLVTPATL